MSCFSGISMTGLSLSFEPALPGRVSVPGAGTGKKIKNFWSFSKSGLSLQSLSGELGVWRSWLAHLVWDQRVLCSSHSTPTKKETISRLFFLSGYEVTPSRFATAPRGIRPSAGDSIPPLHSVIPSRRLVPPCRGYDLSSLFLSGYEVTPSRFATAPRGIRPSAGDSIPPLHSVIPSRRLVPPCRGYDVSSLFCRGTKSPPVASLFFS